MKNIINKFVSAIPAKEWLKPSFYTIANDVQDKKFKIISPEWTLEVNNSDLPVKPFEDFKFTIVSDYFIKILRKVLQNTEQFTFSFNKEKCEINVSGYVLSGYIGDQDAIMLVDIQKDIKDTGIRVKGDTLVHLLSNFKNFVDIETDNYMSCVYLKFKENKIEVVASDGCILAVYSKQVDKQYDERIIAIPYWIISPLLAILNIFIFLFISLFYLFLFNDYKANA